MNQDKKQKCVIVGIPNIGMNQDGFEKAPESALGVCVLSTN
jgi:hypothetical protein